MGSFFDKTEYREDLESILDTDLPWKQMDGKGILITGGTGLVGSGIVDTLILYNEKYQRDSEKQLQIWVLGRNGDRIKERFSYAGNKAYFHALAQDIAQPVEMVDSISYVIHAAGKGDPRSIIADPVGIITANVTGTKNVLDFARKQDDCKVVYISSGEVYGIVESINTEGIHESQSGFLDVMNPRNSYGLSKRMGENLCVSYTEEYGVWTAVARLAHVYGPTAMEDETRVIFQFLNCAKEGKEILLKSAGSQVRSWTYLTDAVRGIFAVLLKGENKQAYNVSNTDAACSIRCVAEIVAEQAGIRIREDIQGIENKSMNSGIEYAVLNNDKVREIGCRMNVGIRDGIRKMLTYSG